MHTGILISIVVSAVVHFASAVPVSPVTPTSSSRSPLPLIIWHGLGDNYEADGLNATAKLAQQVNPGTYVYIIRLAESAGDDRKATFFGNVTNHVAQVCEDLASHPILSKAEAVNGLGFSQGGQFLRAYVERCNSPLVRNLVTFGSQHNGIARFQGCNPTDWLCKAAGNLLAANTWSSFSQSTLVPAQYYRNGNDLDSYLQYSNFLADINNERDIKNKTYKDNLSKLKKFVMYVFEEDETVIPKESGWFAEVNGTTQEVTPLRNRTIYKEDWIGLKEVDKREGLVFEKIPGKHMQIAEKTLEKTFADYFSPESSLPAAGYQFEVEDEWVMVGEGSEDQSATIWNDL